MASYDEIVWRIIRILKETLGVVPQDEPMDTETTLLGKRLGLDSASLLELVVAIEEEFGVHLDERHLTPQVFETLGSLARYVQARCSR